MAGAKISRLQNTGLKSSMVSTQRHINGTKQKAETRGKTVITVINGK